MPPDYPSPPQQNFASPLPLKAIWKTLDNLRVLATAYLICEHLNESSSCYNLIVLLR